MESSAAGAGRRSLAEWARAGISLEQLSSCVGMHLADDPTLAEEVWEDARYAPYLARQDAELNDMRASGAVALGPQFPYHRIPGLSNEMIERLTGAQPETLDQAQRIRGITPAAISAILVHARKLEQVA